MSRRFTWRPEHIWLAAAAVLLLFALVMGIGYAIRKHQWAGQTLSTATPRIARLQGLLESGEALAEAGAALQSNLNDLAYAHERDLGDIGTEALQHVRDAATRRGLRVSSSQTSAAQNGPEGFDRVNLDLRLEGDWDAVLALLRELPAARPAIYVDTAHLSGQGVEAQSPQVIVLQLGLFVLRQQT